MKKYYFIFAGGFLGAILRYSFKNFDYGTLAANILGCFVLGLFLTLVTEYFDLSKNLILGTATGFLGALTTFSTLCKEVVNYIFDKNFFEAFIYLIITLILGFLAVFVGSITAKKFIFYKQKNRKDKNS